MKDRPAEGSSSQSSVQTKQEHDPRALADNPVVREILVVPADLEQSIHELSQDLADVPVVGADGRGTDIFKKIESESTLNAEDKRLVWACLATVRNAFQRLDQEAKLKDVESGYQWNMNWKHTRAELDQVLEAAKLLKLNGKETRNALLASIFSDSVKTRKNFLIHNIHGAQAAAQVLSQLLDQSNQENNLTIDQVTKAVREHQIAPPEFMARAVAITLFNRLNLGRFSEDGGWDHEGTDERSRLRNTIGSIFAKIKDPFNKKHLSKDLSRIFFTVEEKQLLGEIGIQDWWVPHPDSPDSRVTDAVIAGDHSINYNHPEGFAKIALIRGPDTEPIFEDPTVHHSLLSVLHSFADSFRIIRPEVQALAMDGLRRTMAALARVNAMMSQIFTEAAISSSTHATSPPSKSQVVEAISRARKENPSLFVLDNNVVSERGNKQVDQAIDRVAAILEDWWMNYGEIPFQPEDEASAQSPRRTLPFWNSALLYPPRDEAGVSQLNQLSDLEQRQYRFATKIRAIAVELLRAEQWVLSSPG